jgi:hypothetical protein
MKRVFIYLFIDEKVSILTLSSPMLSSKAINFDIMWIKLSYSFIIELDPMIVRLLDIAKVMPKVCRTIMKYDSLQNIIIVRIFSDTFLIINGVRVYIQFLRELPSSVQFFVFKFIVIELHSF